MLQLSRQQALRLGHAFIGSEHILLGLIAENEGVVAQVLMRLGADLRSIRQLLRGADDTVSSTCIGPQLDV